MEFSTKSFQQHYYKKEWQKLYCTAIICVGGIFIALISSAISFSIEQKTPTISIWTGIVGLVTFPYLIKQAICYYVKKCDLQNAYTIQFKEDGLHIHYQKRQMRDAEDFIIHRIDVLNFTETKIEIEGDIEHQVFLFGRRDTFLIPREPWTWLHIPRIFFDENALYQLSTQ